MRMIPFSSLLPSGPGPAPAFLGNMTSVGPLPRSRASCPTQLGKKPGSGTGPFWATRPSAGPGILLETPGLKPRAPEGRTKSGVLACPPFGSGGRPPLGPAPEVLALTPLGSTAALRRAGVGPRRARSAGPPPWLYRSRDKGRGAEPRGAVRNLGCPIMIGPGSRTSRALPDIGPSLYL